MTDKAIFTALAEILEVPNEGQDSDKNPYLTMAKFVFADNKGAPTSTGNGNLQGIEEEDFDEVIRTALHMPVKMNYLGQDNVGNHKGSYVIGHISNMYKETIGDTSQLIAEAYLYSEEYPEEVTFLKSAHANKKAPGISYEVAYGSSIVKSGVEWIKNLITCAATFVRSPAYGNRTALLALASATDEDFVPMMKTLVAQAEGIEEHSIPIDEGGINVDELEKANAEIQRIKAEAATHTAEISRLQEELDAKSVELVTANETITTLQRNNTIETRTRKFTEAGFMLEAEAEKADKKKAFWLTLSDEGFDEYLADITAAKAMAVPATEPKKAEASLRTPTVPRLDTPANSLELPSFRFRD